MNELVRLAVCLAKSRSQRLVPLDEPGQRPFECSRAELTIQPENERHVVCRTARVEAIEEPEPLLGEGQRERHHLARHRGIWQDFCHVSRLAGSWIAQKLLSGPRDSFTPATPAWDRERFSPTTLDASSR